MTGSPLIEVENLRIDLDSGSRRVAAAEGISFRIDRGETFGLVGESGCGKSITALALIGLLRPPLSIGAGAIRFKGREIQHLSALGDRFVAVSAEPVLGLSELCPAGALRIGYSRDVFGYWPREMQIAEGGYEVNVFKPWFGVPHEWRSGLDQLFSKLIA